jgi:hypothetical protein
MPYSGTALLYPMEHHVHPNLKTTAPGRWQSHEVFPMVSKHFQTFQILVKAVNRNATLFNVILTLRPSYLLGLLEIVLFKSHDSLRFSFSRPNSHCSLKFRFSKQRHARQQTQLPYPVTHRACERAVSVWGSLAASVLVARMRSFKTLHIA